MGAGHGFAVGDPFEAGAERRRPSLRARRTCYFRPRGCAENLRPPRRLLLISDE